uniref:DUF6020 family protein n=1 Tax=Gemmiger formicilis TaxID=745368 RepID=UPI004027B6AB
MKQKTKSIVTALLLGVLCAVTLSAVITVPDWETARADLLIGMQYETTGLDLDAVPGWLAALVMLHQNFPLDGWAWGPAAAGLAVLLCWVRGQREAKPKRTELVLSIVFGIAEVLGLSICKLGSWAFVFKNPYQLCVGVLCMAGYAVLFYHAVWGLYALLGRSRTGGEDFPQTRFAAWFAKAPGRASSLLIGAAWLPWVAVFWPGSVDWDSWGQISQVLGVQEMTAHHTVLSTWLHGWLFRLGRALGSDNLGVFLYIVLQFLVCAWVFGQVTAFAARLGCSRGVQYAVTAFFALDPIWGAFIQTQVKDTLYTGLFVLFVLKTADLLLFPQEWQGNRPRLTAYAVLGVLCCLLRKNGIYAVVPMLLASAFTVSEKRLRRSVLAVLLAVCIGSFGFDTFTEKVLDIPAGSVGEALSVPMQQTARYIRDYGNEVTDDERAAIEKVLDCDAIAQSYMPELSDGVKQYYKNPGKGDLTRYMLVWAKMLLKHPVCYFEATHANSHGYYTITKCRAINDYYTFNNDSCMEMSEMNVHYLDKSGYLRYAFVQALSAFEKLPLVGLTTSIGFMAWLTAVLGLWLARCKAKPVLPVFIGLGIFWLTCIASPVNDCIRYFLPVAGCLPLVFCLAAVFSREKSEITV